jgi:hypothetical protein
MPLIGLKSLKDGTRRLSVCSILAVVLLGALGESAHAIVRRRLNVNSNPQGALVYVDNQQVGVTPCSVDFTYYGTREIRLIKPGFETLTVNQPIPAPWYEYLGLDFISENLVTTKIRDNRTVNYNLAPQLIVPTQELIDRGNQLRQDTLQYGTAPVIGAPVGPNVPAAAVVAPGPPTPLPPVVVPEQLPPPPGRPTVVPQQVVPQPAPQPIVPQPAPAAPPGGAPLIPPRL